MKKNKAFEDLEKALSKPLEYSVVHNPDGTFRDMTDEEKANFKPTHVETWGSKDGIDGCFKTCLATGETQFIPLIILPYESNPGKTDDPV